MTSRNKDVRLNSEDDSSPSLKHNAKKKFKSSEISVNINPIYFEKELMKQFSESFKKKNVFSCEGSGTQVFTEPFTCCVLPNFVKNQEFLEDLQDELLKLDFQEKSNDLYKFHQSQALQNLSSPNILALKNLLYKDFTKWLTDVTNITFTDTIDMTCARYEYTDTLLCHDDELEGRRIAFIFYLVPPWKEEDGGSLDLFDVDEDGQPKDIMRSLLPRFNNFVFFEVNPVSFHQVAEVLSKSKCRLSISGWFHGETISRPPPYIEPRKIRTPYQEIEEEIFYDWISPLYLDLENQTEIMDRFQEDSEIQLQGFFAEDKYNSLCEALSNHQIKWKRLGPANKRQYEVADKESLPSIVQQCLCVMRSEMMFLLLSNFTALKLHPLAPDQERSDDEEEGNSGKRSDKEEWNDQKVNDQGESTEQDESSKKKQLPNSDDAGETSESSKSLSTDQIPSCHGDVRRWQHGDYTLLHDTDTEGSEFALDAIVYFNCKEWKNEYGGFTSYLAKGEDEELLSVAPKENCLSLVYRDKDTLRFVKHINHRATEHASRTNSSTCFNDISFVYYE
ncbi:prolyl 3-hydroxylase OGFOD1-like [Anneissia japonica]|uniref:prolyl 3-hydroxylase OGFOD1-like n=1 Tax=Anneissia japonica TaxID=1529436 RepID=UPI001425B124|nr:prolyl 3-hydroxylase OGFOD1-like [Anneissia japonica]